jgi:hypothetical protein
MRSVQTLEEAESAADLDLLREDRPLVLEGAVRRKPVLQIFGEGGEVDLVTLDAAPLHIEQVVRRDAVHPSLELALEIELTKAGHDTYEDLLGGVLGVLRMPQDAERQSVNVVL